MFPAYPRSKGRAKSAVRAAFACLAVASVSAPANAQNLTNFAPDIVMECFETNTGERSSRCSYQCYTIPRPQDGPISSWPSIIWLFERIEFFSKSGRQSENWLIAVRGRPQSPAIKANSVFFITVGTSFLCTYTPSLPSAGVEPTEVRMSKYY